MKKYLALGFMGVIALTGCADKAPGDDLTAKTIRPYAEDALLPDTELANFERENGWIDDSNAGRYIVQYKFDYILTKPLYLAVLDGARKSHTIRGDTAENLASVSNVNKDFGVDKWVAQQGDSFELRAGLMLRDCPECATWLRTGDALAQAVRLQYFLQDWQLFELYRFEDRAPAGGKISHAIRAKFIKSEHGWQQDPDDASLPGHSFVQKPPVRVSSEELSRIMKKDD